MGVCWLGFFFLIMVLISLFDYLVFLILKVCWLTDFYTVGCPSYAWLNPPSLVPLNRVAAEGRVGVLTAGVLNCLQGNSRCKNRRTRQSLRFLTYIPSSWKLLKLPVGCGGILQHISVGSCYFSTFHNDFQGKSCRRQENAWVKCCANCVSFDTN